ncbi:MAG: hypothetical protein HDS30_02395 [Bacteroides sp.]|nr:hypothetical protein [Bacteroides sp.]
MNKWFYMGWAISAVITYIIIGPGDFLSRVFISALAGILGGIFIWIIFSLMFGLSYKDKREVVEWLNKKREEYEEKMLYAMQYRHVQDAAKEIERLFRANPKMELHRYLPFRAWYKYHKDFQMRDAEFYARLVEDGMTPVEEDPLYDPEAPAWEHFTWDRYQYGDEFDPTEDLSGRGRYHCYEDDDITGGRSLRKDAEEGFYFGAGFGAGDSLFNN